MKIVKSVCLVFLSFMLVFVASCNIAESNADFAGLPNPVIRSETPPMGWNSFDAYDCRINEADFKEHVDYIADNLKQYGWEYVVVDYIWWHPEPGNWNTPRRWGHPNIRYKDVNTGEVLRPEYTTMDEYGRLQPAVERFPSAANGKGFKPLVDYVHSKGLKFGLHIMRGIHRYAWFKDTPIKDSEYTARQAGINKNTCNWCNHMFTVDPVKPGAQDYYDSIFQQYADWGVDFVKADDMMIPLYREGEIEMMRKAIEKTGRKILLSLSCGDAPLGHAEHVSNNSTMWRISADFWDKWPSLRRNFDLLGYWQPYIGDGTWPDADMLPLGRISLDNRPHGEERQTKFTWPEQYTMMNLWCIARSPLMLGADLKTIDDKTLKLLTNKEVIYVNQHSTNNRQVYKNDTAAVWIAEDSKSDDVFVAMFNLLDEQAEVGFVLAEACLSDKYTFKDLWVKGKVGPVEKSISVVLDSHGSAMFRLTKVK